MSDRGPGAGPVEDAVVLVTGATGRQGGAVTKALRRAGHRVRGMTRSPEGARATYLASRGVEVVRGDLTDPASVAAAAKGCTAVFLVTGLDGGPEREVRAGLAALEGILAAGRPHTVLASVASCDRDTGVPHFDSKWRLEQALRSSGLPFTVVAPVFFMENPRPSLAATGGRVLASPLPPDRPLQQVCLEDIGQFVRWVVEHPASSLGRRFEIAGDELTGERAAEVLGRVTGRPVTYRPLEPDPRMLGADLAAMFRWLAAEGYRVDVPGLHRQVTEVGWHSFEEWARGREWPGDTGPGGPARP
ncbi:NmrA/HSCARG family protein [Streptomyces cinnamoneus]|uniref:NmrA/HSCARG family protein n=1 Tax=Streptomyces cinnamoneus TaxID=53446 RepID=UPI00342BF2F8